MTTGYEERGVEEWKEAEVRRSRMSVLVDCMRSVVSEDSAQDGGCTAGESVKSIYILNI
jgi:hypothetical protein